MRVKKELVTDEDLFGRLRHNDEGAFRELFMRHFAHLCAFVHTIVRAEQKAQDVVQRVFVKLWEKRRVLEIAQNVLAYLFKSCRNEAYNFIKMENTRRKYEEQYMSDYAEVIQYERKVASGVDIDRLVNEAIEQLPEKCKQIYTLSKKEGLTYQEIAKFMKISEKTVENQIGIALRKLRETLKPQLSLINE